MVDTQTYTVYLQHKEPEVYEACSVPSFQGTPSPDTEDAADSKDYTAIFALTAVRVVRLHLIGE